MLIEIKAVRQSAGQPRKRWFNDADFDLFTWHRTDGSVCRFELCYDKHLGEHTVRWDAREGVETYSVDDGEVTGRHKMAPLTIADDSPLDPTVTDRFRAAARELDPAIVAVVCARLGLPPVQDAAGP